jgi:hypothetical protein
VPRGAQAVEIVNAAEAMQDDRMIYDSAYGP